MCCATTRCYRRGPTQSTRPRKTSTPLARVSLVQVGGECSLDEVKMRSGLDPRTTLMIRNIPNKYTEEMLLSKFDHLVPGAFDFFYLPMDEKNKCNVGYAFINVSAQPFVPVIYDLLHNKKWDRFNSEKARASTHV